MTKFQPGDIVRVSEDSESYAGQLVRIVRYWRNDAYRVEELERPGIGVCIYAKDLFRVTIQTEWLPADGDWPQRVEAVFEGRFIWLQWDSQLSTWENHKQAADELARDLGLPRIKLDRAGAPYGSTCLTRSRFRLSLSRRSGQPDELNHTGKHEMDAEAEEESERCSECSAYLADSEGWDGLCGPCADLAESASHG